MKKFRVISDGFKFKVQKRVYLFFWETIQRPSNEERKDFGGDQTFDLAEDAYKYIHEQTTAKWRVLAK